ncbi:MAG: SEC-C domain-containing protein [Acidiferrobacterales bacterium]|jgi:SEC-C motif-containing protein|nr:SEC-C domain-containing protein [Acidiferrobacterales bacterium]
MKPSDDCPCGSGQFFARCCGVYLGGNSGAPTAAALMRSRYCAYALGDEAYLLRTWHPSTRPQSLGLGQEATPQWIGLKLIAALGGNEKDADGSVEFVARYKVNGKAHRLHEVSRFVKEQGEWFYLDGKLDNES